MEIGLENLYVDIGAWSITGLVALDVQLYNHTKNVERGRELAGWDVR